MTTPRTELTITFQRNASKHFDDTLVISQDSKTGEFFLTSNICSDASCAERLTHAQKFTRHGLSRYIQDILQLQLHDSDPFTYIQVDFPTAPSVCIDVSRLEKSLETVVRVMDACFGSWPKLQTRAVTERQHTKKHSKRAAKINMEPDYDDNANAIPTLASDSLLPSPVLNPEDATATTYA